MLAVTANWNFTDGTLAAPRTAAAQTWLATIRRAAIRAGFGRDGRYQPVESICLVFAGDTFDWLLSDVWSGRDRPWLGGPRGLAARARVAAASLGVARPVLRSLHRWIRTGVPLPAGDARGRPSLREVRHVPARVVMLAGNRDAWINGGFEHDGNTTGRFGVLVGESWSDGNVTIRHGHDLDPLWHAMTASPMPAAGGPPTLGESLAVDLVVPFAVTLRAEVALWSLAKSRIGSLATSLPWELPGGIARLVAIQGPGSGMGRRLLAMWRRSVEGWHARARSDPPLSDTSYDPLDALAAWLDTAASGQGLPVDPSISRLAIPRSIPNQRNAVLGHVPPSEAGTGLGGGCGPWLAVMGDDPNSGWLEHLGIEARSPSVVAIGASSGSVFVEAA